uniref:DNA topoisomerase 2 n=1 Tax=Megaviridae environmental sample TaxID=1737588 RepID=A0A5J6VI37_9VIRU|nr:MAG: DNA gyrase/topoisomerase IV, subunit A [Megaviridae environmental sample]
MEQTIEEKYQRLTQIEHVHKRPTMYVGSIDKSTCERLVVQDGKLVKKTLTYSPALEKLNDEVLTNAKDARTRQLADYTRMIANNIEIPNHFKVCDCIKITIDRDNESISIENNGSSIPIVKNTDHDMWVPEMIFGEFMSGSNFTDDQSLTGGTHGLGVKLVNVFSQEFHVEIVDGEQKKMWRQTFRDEMQVKEKPKITTCKKKPYVKITFKPNLSRFSCDSFEDGFIQLVERRAYDMAATTEGCKVYLNGERLNMNFEKYVKMYQGVLDESPEPLVTRRINDRWQIGVIVRPDNGFEHISFVNGISTYRGGSHVDHVVDQIVKKITEAVKKKTKAPRVKSSLIKNHLVVFIDANIENASFDSQSKESLVTKVEKFGSTCILDDTFMGKLLKTPLVDRVVASIKETQFDNMKTTDGSKSSRIKGIAKLDDAKWAGTNKSNQCYLILTEGDSAKASAMSGLSVVGRERFGVFPLRGKLLNVREASAKQLLANEEITNIKKIIGLQQNQDYSDPMTMSKLRYGGGIIIFADQDTDGSHIKGLLMNCFHWFWPSLVKDCNFIHCLCTPIIKAFKKNQTKVFYNLPTYEKWKSTNKTNLWKIKYYKGLGTSTAKEAREYFDDIWSKLQEYTWGEHDENAITLAFSKDRANDRKTWLMGYDRNIVLDNSRKNVTYDDFVNQELIHFSNEDNERSIPSVIDGLKPSQRKILFASYMRKLDKDEIKVSQLSGYVSDRACYHHGEASLNGAIIGMAQDFCGSNNLNWLNPNGQFGTRLKGGKDAASPRYIWTSINPTIEYIINKRDTGILETKHDDGIPVEPECYFPIIPMVLVNGADGIGTGFSTHLPSYRPNDIIDALLEHLNNPDAKWKDLIPWYKGFNGNLHIEDDKLVITGIYECMVIKNHTVIHVTELPVGLWTDTFKEYLEGLIDKKLIHSYTSSCTDTIVDFMIKLPPEHTITNNGGTAILNKLQKKISLNNIHLYSGENQIRKYSSCSDILDEFYDYRMEAYVRRKQMEVKVLMWELLLLESKMRFIQEVLDNELEIFRRPKQAIISDLETREYPMLSTSFYGDKSYDYVTNMPLFALTKERLDQLEEQITDKQNDLTHLQETSEVDIWKNELRELRKHI